MTSDKFEKLERETQDLQKRITQGRTLQAEREAQR